MNAIILAAGYATRLYPLTKDFPKPLLNVGKKTILDLLMDQLDGIDDLREVTLVSNNRFAPLFEQWIAARHGGRKISLLNDGSMTQEDRLGALGDLRLAMADQVVGDDVLVMAADNILRFPLADLLAAFRSRRAPHICVHRIEDVQRLRRTGVATLGTDNRVVSFSEKPAEPESNWAVPPIYVFPREILPSIVSHLSAAGSTDAPGYLIEWLCRETPVYAHEIKGAILDVGTPASLDDARALLSERQP